MGKPLLPYERAGRLFRLVAWLQVLVFVFPFALLLLIGGPELRARWTRDWDANPDERTFVLLLCAIVVGLSIFELFLGKAIREHRSWSRIVGIALAVVFLVGFPLGTMIGGYIIWCLATGWSPYAHTAGKDKPVA